MTHCTEVIQETTRKGLKKAVRALVARALSIGNLDLHSVKWRLDSSGAARHAEVSAILSVEDPSGGGNDYLLDLTTSLIKRCKQVRLPLLEERKAPEIVKIWPGEHYRLLSALVQELSPNRVVEVGTYTGLSALAMLPDLKRGARLTTFDVIAWNEIPDSFLRASDFADAVLTQILGDLSKPAVAKQHAAVLQEADLLFVDGPKDGVFEKRLLENFTSCLKPGALLVFDDIRVWNMLTIWHAIAQPKLDITSFGHWSGTGMVQWP